MWNVTMPELAGRKQGEKNKNKGTEHKWKNTVATEPVKKDTYRGG